MKGRNKPAAKRRRQRERFIMIPCDLLVRSDWIHLPPAARVIFLGMCMLHHHGGERGPSNNGRIGYGSAAAGRAANASAATGFRMLKELLKSRLIKPRKVGVFKVETGDGQAHEWEIAIYPMRGRPPFPWGKRALRIDHWLLKSAAYKGLSNQAKCILLELMRRFDGGNNGSISFGGVDGVHTGFSTDVTERALINLERSRFIVQTAAAVPHLSHPREWRLTLYAADRNPATKDFMRDADPVSAKKLERFTGADDPHRNVSMMRPSLISNLPSSEFPAGNMSANARAFLEKDPKTDSRAGETFYAADTRTSETHLETSPADPDWTGSDLPVPKNSPGFFEEFDRVEISAEIAERPTGLFGDALPPMRTPLDQLRLDLRRVVSRRRGMQSRLAEALGITRQTFANALSGRERFSATAMGVLRRWLDRETVAGDWPPLPPATEEVDAA